MVTKGLLTTGTQVEYKMTSSNSTASAPTKRTPSKPANKWQFTINNPNSNTLPDRFINNSQFITWQLEEAPQTGTPHLQGYLVLKPNEKNAHGRSLKWLKDNICPFTHWTPCTYGTHDNCLKYCNKEESRKAGPWTLGEYTERHELTSSEKKKGGDVNKSKIDAVKRKIDQGVKEIDLYDQHFGEMLRYGKAFDRYRTIKINTRRTWHTTGVYIYGPPGTGKSKLAFDKMKEWYGDDVYFWTPTGDRQFMDGYTGQQGVVVNEFHGQMPISKMLELLDRYPLNVETKGSAVPFAAKTIVFTSNVHIKDIYGQPGPHGEPSKVTPATVDALLRRFQGKNGMIIELTTPMTIQDDREDFVNLWNKPVTPPTPPTPPSEQRHSMIDIRKAQQMPVDLTDEDDNSEERFTEIINNCSCDDCGLMNKDCRCYDDEEEVWQDTTQQHCEECGQAHHKCLCSYTDQPALKRRNAMTSQTTFELVAPPKATASEWKAVKQVPGQTKLVINSVTATQRLDDDF